MPPPDLEGRYETLRVHTRNMKLGSDVDLKRLAEETDLFTGAELEGLCREAGIVALREDINATVVCDRHFQTVKKSLKPALTTEDIDSYSSFMKGSSLRVNQAKHRAEYPSKSVVKFSASLSRSIIVIISLVVVAAAKFLPWRVSGSASQTVAT